MQQTADVVIIGAGLAGCSVAHHLSPHRRVVVLDQAAQPGAEASAQNAGMVRRLGEDPWERALAVRTHAWLTDPGEDWSEAPPSRRVGAVLGLTADPQHLNDAVAHLRARGIQVEQCDRPAEIAPALAGSPLTRAWWLPDERVADAHALVSGFLRQLGRHGGRVVPNTRVTGIVVEGERAVGVRTDAGEWSCDAVVLAAGAWSAPLAATAGVHRPLVALRRTLLQSDPHPLSTPDHPWVWVDDVGVYARPEAGGWLVSGCDETVDPPSPEPGSRGPVEHEHRALAATKLDRYLPALADARLSRGWSGLRTFAPDRRPILGADPERPGLWWAAGLGGFGVTCSKAVGEAVAAWMVGQTLDWIRERPLSPGRSFLRRWPIRPTGDLHTSQLIDV
jgi:D-arginine dehydrogenase